MKKFFIFYLSLICIVLVSCLDDYDTFNSSFDTTSPCRVKVRKTDEVRSIAIKYLNSKGTFLGRRVATSDIDTLSLRVEVLTKDMFDSISSVTKQSSRKKASMTARSSDTLMYYVNTSQSTLLVPAYSDAIPIYAELENPNFNWSDLFNSNGIRSPLTELVVPALDPDYWKIFEPWTDWIAPLDRQSSVESRVYPKLCVEWSQHYPYNKYCPSNYAAGCVAIAVAQSLTVTQNWEYIDTIKVDYDRLLTYQNFENNWMDYALADTIARIVRYIGKEVDMKYSANGSSANTQKAVRRFFSNMIINTSKEGVRKALNMEKGIVIVSSRTKSDWLGIIPRGDGHAYIIDGYVNYFNGDSYLHVNFGWGSSYNGFFMKNIFSPAFIENAKDKYPYEMNFYSVYPI